MMGPHLLSFRAPRGSNISPYYPQNSWKGGPGGARVGEGSLGVNGSHHSTSLLPHVLSVPSVLPVLCSESGFWDPSLTLENLAEKCIVTQGPL